MWCFQLMTFVELMSSRIRIRNFALVGIGVDLQPVPVTLEALEQSFNGDVLVVAIC
jgi:hypothetical protein